MRVAFQFDQWVDDPSTEFANEEEGCMTSCVPGKVFPSMCLSQQLYLYCSNMKNLGRVRSVTGLSLQKIMWSVMMEFWNCIATWKILGLISVTIQGSSGSQGSWSRVGLLSSGEEANGGHCCFVLPHNSLIFEQNAEWKWKLKLCQSEESWTWQCRPSRNE